jgi:hypothetical protein
LLALFCYINRQKVDFHFLTYTKQTTTQACAWGF